MVMSVYISTECRKMCTTVMTHTCLVQDSLYVRTARIQVFRDTVIHKMNKAEV